MGKVAFYCFIHTFLWAVIYISFRFISYEPFIDSISNTNCKVLNTAIISYESKYRLDIILSADRDDLYCGTNNTYIYHRLFTDWSQANQIVETLGEDITCYFRMYDYSLYLSYGEVYHSVYLPILLYLFATIMVVSFLVTILLMIYSRVKYRFAAPDQTPQNL